MGAGVGIKPNTGSGKGGAGGGGGSGSAGAGGAGDGSGGGGEGGGGGAGEGEGDGSGEGRYCPEAGRQGPPPMEQHMRDMDLRRGFNFSNATPQGREAALAATAMAPGGAAGAGQAFWSGSGRQVATAQGYSVQEDRGGAQRLESMGNIGWNQEMGQGSGVTGERAWKTISMRSAENASGRVDAFVVGTARPGNVFSSVELPTLLHNPNVDEIVFRDPAAPTAPGTPWRRGSDGCWSGPSVPGGGPPGRTVPGFSLHPSQGFTRP